jgi:hypothetical protein
MSPNRAKAPKWRVWAIFGQYGLADVVLGLLRRMDRMVGQESDLLIWVRDWNGEMQLILIG